MNRLIGRVEMISQEDTDDFGKELEYYEVQVWKHTPTDQEFDDMFEFDNYNEAVKKCNKIKNYKLIQLWKYDYPAVTGSGEGDCLLEVSK